MANSGFDKNLTESILIIVLTLAGLVFLLGFFTLLFVLYSEIRRAIFFKKAIPKYKQELVKSQQQEKDRITELKTKIETGLDVEMPGFDKASDAWLVWSRKDRRGLGRWLEGDLKPGFSAYYNVLCHLKEAERAMRLARDTRRNLEDVIEEMEEAKTDATVGVRWPSKYDRLAKSEREIRKFLEKCETNAEERKLAAALVWGIYWPEQVEKAKLKKAKMSGLSSTQV